MLLTQGTFVGMARQLPPVDAINLRIDGTNYGISGTNYEIDGTNCRINRINFLFDTIKSIFYGIILSFPPTTVRGEPAVASLEYPHLLKGQLNDTLENKGPYEIIFPRQVK